MKKALEAETMFKCPVGAFGRGKVEAMIVDSDDVENDICYCHSADGEWSGTMTSEKAHEAFAAADETAERIMRQFDDEVTEISKSGKALKRETIMDYANRLIMESLGSPDEPKSLGLAIVLLQRAISIKMTVLENESENLFRA